MAVKQDSRDQAADTKVVFFDFGGVFTVSPFSAIGDMAEARGARPEQLMHIVFGDYGEDGDHPWHRLERGELSLEDTRLAIQDIGRSQHGLEIDLYELFAAMPRDGGLRHELVERVSKIRDAGLQTAIITNNVKEFAEGWRSLLPVDELFDRVFDSCELGIRKPNAEIYRHALDAMQVRPEQALFLDDFQANVDSARALGIDCIWVREPLEECWRELDQRVLMR